MEIELYRIMVETVASDRPGDGVEMVEDAIDDEQGNPGIQAL